MRARFVILCCLVPSVALIAAPTSALAWHGLSSGSVTFAQEEEAEGQTGGGEGQKKEQTQVEPGAEEAAEATPEEGPLWTYQMARIILVLLFFLLLAIGALYYRMLYRRQKSTA